MNQLWNFVSYLFVIIVWGMDINIMGFSLNGGRGLFTGNYMRRSFDLQHPHLISRNSPETAVSLTTKTTGLPIELPVLSTGDLKRLARGERVQKQSRSERSG